MRRLVCASLGGVVLLSGVGCAMQADGERFGRLAVEVDPKRQIVVAGGDASFSVTVRHGAGAGRVVRLSVRDLPDGLRAHWRRDDGTRGGTVASAHDGATLTLHAARSVRPRHVRIRIVASAGGRSAATRAVVRVARRRSLGFALRAAPRRRVVATGQTAAYRLHLVRQHGFRRSVRLSVRGLPAGTRATWLPRRPRRDGRRATLRVRVAAHARPGSRRLVVTGRARMHGRWLRRSAVVVLRIGRPRAFAVDGDLRTPLHPGASVPLDLTLDNPHSFPLQITRLRVAVRGTSRAACRADEHFAVRQFAGRYPLTLAPGRTTLGTLVGDRRRWPHVVMRDLPRNQDACKGTTLLLEHDGRAVR